MRAKRYDAMVQALVLDPIIREMAVEVPDEIDMESFEFMRKALDEYKRRGGELQPHLGGCAEAIRKVRRQYMGVQG